MRKIEAGKKQIEALKILCQGASVTGIEICKDQVKEIKDKLNSMRRKVWTKLEAQK